MDSVDVAVAGAGPVGLAAAIHARLAGLSVRVFERRTGLLDKACGEGLMPAGVAALEHMGVRVPAHERHPLRGIRYIDGKWVAEGAFARGAVGWGVRRLALAGALAQRAEDLDIAVQRGCAVTHCDMGDDAVTVHTGSAQWRARYLVGADGLHSKVRAWAGLPSASAALRRFGVRRHFALAPWSDHVEVYWQRGVEAYVTPVAPRVVNIAFLWQGGSASFDALLARFPSLQSRVRGATQSSEDRGAGPFAQNLPRRTAGRVALVGDAAGYLDALTGEGLTLGFRSGAALAHVLASSLPLASYEAAYRTLSADYYRSTRALLAVSQRPWLRRCLIVALARVPGAFDRLLAWHGQSASPSLNARFASPAGS